MYTLMITLLSLAWCINTYKDEKSSKWLAFMYGGTVIVFIIKDLVDSFKGLT